MLDFYYFYPACSQAAHIALEESGLQFNPILVNLKDPAGAVAYKKINPRATVPLLVHDGVQLLENVAIMSYIDVLAPQATLMPTDPMQRAQCLSFLVWGASTAHINYRMANRPERYTSDVALHDGIRAVGRPNYWATLQTLNERLAKQDWIMGEDFTAADGYVLRFYDWGRMAKFPMDELKALTAHMERMLARPAVRRVLEREGSTLVQLVAAQ